MSAWAFHGWRSARDVHSQSRLPLLRSLRDGQALARVSRFVVNDKDITRALQDMILPLQFWQRFEEDPDREIDWLRGYCAVRAEAALGFPSKQHWLAEGLEFRAKGEELLSALGHSRRSRPMVDLNELASWLRTNTTGHPALTEERCKALFSEYFPGQRISREALRNAMKQAGVTLPRGRPKNAVVKRKTAN